MVFSLRGVAGSVIRATGNPPKMTMPLSLVMGCLDWGFMRSFVLYSSSSPGCVAAIRPSLIRP